MKLYDLSVWDAKLSAILVALIFLIGGDSLHASPQRAQQKNFVPLVDHHQHLLSAAGAASKLPAIELPHAFATLVRDREKNWNKAAGLGPTK